MRREATWSARRKAGPRSFWPTQEQELLLKAALLRGPRAMEAWRAWRSHIDVDQLDRGSRSLLPLLYRNLTDHNVEDPLMDRFRGVYRRTWYENHTRFREVASLLRAFHGEGIQTMILKGAALTLLQYKDHGARPMEDIDVLVPTEQAAAAIGLPAKLGWIPWERPLEAFGDEYLSTRHSHGFRDAANRQLDLHWHALADSRYSGADDDFWHNAVPVEISDTVTRALDPTDQLLHVCVHGILGKGLTPLFLWIADATTILNTSGVVIDWQRLVAHARKRRLVLQLEDALTYLEDLLHAPIPPTALQSLQSTHVSWIERLEHRTRTRLPGLTGRLPRLWFHFLRSSQRGDGAPLRFGLWGFPSFLQATWGLNHLWQLGHPTAEHLCHSKRRVGAPRGRALTVTPSTW